MFTNWFGISNTAPEGIIPDSVKWSFYVGGVVFFLAVLWTVIKSREYSPEQLLESSIAWVDSIESRSPPSDDVADVVWAKSEQERLERKFLRGRWTRDEMDSGHGRGGWRPLVRFAIAQGEKWRVKVNGKSSHHNIATSTEERIHTTST